MRLSIIRLYVLSATVAVRAHAGFSWNVPMPAWRPRVTFPIVESPKLNFADVLIQHEIQEAMNIQRTLLDLPQEHAFYPAYNIRPPINHGPAFDPAFEIRPFVKDGSSFNPNNERQPTYKQKNKNSDKKIEDLLDNAEDLVDLIENIDFDGEDSENQTETGPTIMYGGRPIKHGATVPVRKNKLKKSLGKKIKDALPDADELSNTFDSNDSDDGQNNGTQTEAGLKIVDEAMIVYGRRPSIKHVSPIPVRKNKKNFSKKIKDSLADADELSNTFDSNDSDDGQNNGTQTEAGLKIVDEAMIVYGRRPSIKHVSPIPVRKNKKNFSKKIKDSLADADDELNNMFDKNNSDKNNTTWPETAPKVIDDLVVIGINESIANP